TKITEGIVIGLDFGAWAGFTSGRITLRGEDEGRKEFHYGQYAKGVVPDIGDLVRIQYVGSKILEISSIEVLDSNRETLSERVAVQMNGMNLIFGRPKAAIAIILAEVIAGLWIILIGLILGLSRPAAPVIYGVTGCSQIFIGWLIWENTGRG
ncbi:MAG: hypothetical protein ACFFED_14780, partial [Candidatus Thorarchaeota archaeon]